MAFRSKSVIEPVQEKSDRRRSLAERCLNGEFGGSAWVTSQQPECIALGVSRQSIQYQMDRIDPVEACIRGADGDCDSGGGGNSLYKHTLLSLSRGVGRLQRRRLSSGIVGKFESD